jgi:hypothetical protein
MAKRVGNYNDGLVKGYKMGVEEGKKEALIELQKNNTNTDLPSNETLKKIFRLFFESKKQMEMTHSLYMNEWECHIDYITKNWNKENEQTEIH